MRRIELNQIQAAALEKIARRSKMDCWFSCQYSDNKITAREIDINTLFDGATIDDIVTLSIFEVSNLFDLLLKCNKIKRP